MKDCFGRDIKAGDLVAYTSNCNGPRLQIGEVLGYCKNGSDKVRVRVFQSSNYWFRAGHKNYHTGKEILPGTPYVTTISVRYRVVIINGADLSRS